MDPVGSLAARAGRGGGPRSGPEQSPEPSAPLRRSGPARDAPPMFSLSAGRSRPEVWSSPAGEPREQGTVLLVTGLNTQSHDIPSVYGFVLYL